MKRQLWIMMLCLGMVLAVTALAACGDDDDDDDGGDDGGNTEEQQEIADIALKLATTNGDTATQEEIDFYLAHITDAFLQDFGTESIEVCAEDAASCIGQPLDGATVDVADIEVDGDEATVVAGSDFGPQGIAFIKEDDVWKANGTFVANDEIAEGTEVVDLELVDFAFDADLDSDAVKSGDFAFHVTNAGEQVHEVILVALPAEGTIEELLDDPSFEPDPIFVKVPYEAGDESDVALPAPLDPGRYGLVCFLPDTDDPEQTPHAFKGMVAEFTVE